MARPALLLGVNQTVNLALGIVVIAALVGAEGLGQVVLAGLQNLLSPDGGVGLAFAGGLAIVAIAIDLRPHDAWPDGRRGARVPSVAQSRTAAGRAARGRRARGVAVVVIAKAVGAGSFPTSVHWDIVRPINDAVDWIKENVEFLESDQRLRRHQGAHARCATSSPTRRGGRWPGAVTAIGWASGGRRVAATVAVGTLLVIAGLQVPHRQRAASGTTRWTRSRRCSSRWCSRWRSRCRSASSPGAARRFEAAIRPLLDAMQVMPAFVYLVPVDRAVRGRPVPGDRRVDVVRASRSGSA